VTHRLAGAVAGVVAVVLVVAGVSIWWRFAIRIE
jgi:hypothetical protein